MAGQQPFFSLLHFAATDEEGLHQAKQKIEQELEAGRNVMLICEEEVLKRVECVTFASLAFKNARARLAIVVRDVAAFTELIPATMVPQVHLFSCQDDAAKWLAPTMSDAMKTIRYVNLQ